MSVGRLSWSERIGGLLVGLLLLCMLLAFVWTPHNPLTIDLGQRLHVDRQRAVIVDHAKLGDQPAVLDLALAYAD